MPKRGANDDLQPDAEELILCQDDRYVCETYMFEPSSSETELGFLFAAAETEDRDGVGAELVDTIITAIQKEYYRDKQRSPENAFEMALHQANLILHDAAEAGMRDWMGYFHVTVGALVGDQLHLSVAGSGKVWLVRSGQLTNISAGLAHSPITNALKTFSQIATGELTGRDTIFLTSAHFDAVFRPIDVTRFTLDHSAATIASRLEQLYADQKQEMPLAMVVISMLPQYMSQKSPRAADDPNEHEGVERQGVSQANIRPRQPLMIRRSTLQKIFLFIAQIFVTLWKWARQYIWPMLKLGSRKGGRVVVKASRATGRSVYSVATRGKKNTMEGQSKRKGSFKEFLLGLVGWIIELPSRTVQGMRSLPRTSRIFAVIAVVLVVALIVSVVLLQSKRATDEHIQQASEMLHEATTKKDAAETALIYDNRDQARTLLVEAGEIVSQLAATGLYEEETTKLEREIQTQNDRLQRVTRAGVSEVREIGDLSEFVSGQPPNNIFFVDQSLYTYNPDDNAIIKVGLDGNAEIVHETTQGIGFVSNGVAHPQDKTITFATTPEGVALFDARDDTFTSQDISFASGDSQIIDLAVFGNRLYVYDGGSDQIYSYNKTLRGYSSGSPWILDEDFPKGDIRSIAIDGSVYTLHEDGSIRELFKGEAVELAIEKVDPPLASANNLITNDDMQYLYVVDTTNRRVVIFSKEGALIQQVFLDGVESVLDVAIDPDETKLYVLDGTRVLEVVLEEEEVEG